MAYTRILLDTNCYLRLGKSINPLLGTPFGENQYALYLHKEIQRELDRSSRIQNKFSWIYLEEHIAERKKIITFSKVDKQIIEDTYDHIWNYQNDEELNLSREDIYCLATALVLNIILVTDETNMLKVANIFNIQAIDTLKLLKIMHSNSFIKNRELKSLFGYLLYIDDFPKSWKKRIKKLFPSIRQY